jgi:hypothetical protein
MESSFGLPLSDNCDLQTKNTAIKQIESIIIEIVLI